MIPLLVVAGVLFIIGVGITLWARGRLKVLKNTPTVQASQVAALAAIGSSRCEVVGIARPGERGLLRSPLSDTPCVWHRVRVERHWEEREGDSASARRSETVSDESSDAPILLEESDGNIVIDMRSADVDHAERTATDDGSGLTVGINVRFGNDDERLERSEWILTEGSQLFVSGKPVSVGDQLGIGEPADGRLLVSTRSEAAIAGSATKARLLGIALIGSSLGLLAAAFLS